MALRDFIAMLTWIAVLVPLAWTLYRPRVQQSDRYQAMVAPLANIMDVLQAVIAAMIAARSKSWMLVAGLIVIGLTMATITIFGLPISLP